MGTGILWFKSNEHSYYEFKGQQKPYFEEDGIRIKDANDKDISETEFKKLIKERINDYIYPFENIVLLAGAGASIVSNAKGKPDLKYGHTLEMLSIDILKTLKYDKDVYSVQEMSNFCKYLVSVEKNGSYNSEFNLEDFLSKVLIYEEFLEDEEIKKKYIRTKDTILRIIKDKTSYDYDVERHKHGFLINTLSRMHKAPYRLTIVTTNYDTLFEEAANSLNYTVFDGFSFDSKSVFDADLYDWSFVKPILNVKSEKMEYKKTTINLLKLHGSLTWKRSEDSIVRVPKNNNVEPIMIFPSSDKYFHSYEKPYFELFSKFQELIKRPNTLLITTGFSFADNHIAKMITQAIKTSHSLSVLITDHVISSEKKCDNWQEIEVLMKSRYRIAFLKATVDTDLTDYFGD